MRVVLRIVVMFCAFVLLAGSDMKNADLVQQLENLGFFHLADDPAAARQEIEKRGWAGIYAENGRWYHADSEDLSEQGVGSFFRELARFFRKVGLAPPTVVDHFGPNAEDGYTVVVNGRSYAIWSRVDIAKETGSPGSIWGASGVHTVDILNDLLASAGVPERAYGILGGNDFAIMFLTREQFKAIVAAPGFKTTDGPYAPRDEYPMHGMPEE